VMTAQLLFMEMVRLNGIDMVFITVLMVLLLTDPMVVYNGCRMAFVIDSTVLPCCLTQTRNIDVTTFMEEW